PKCNKELVDAFNQFALDLHRDLSTDDPNGNLIFSPYSVASCFLMVLLGTAGETADSIAEVFHITQAIRESVHKYRRCIDESINGHESVKLNTVNRVYPATTLNLLASYTDAITEYYGEDAKIEPLDFKKTEESRKIINDWIANVTNNKLQNVIQPDNIDAMTVIVLVNAIYFKGTWKYKFLEKETHKSNFFTDKDTSTEVDMMVHRTHFPYTNSPPSILDAQIVELPYVGDTVSMVILLPNDRFRLAELEQKLTLAMLKDEMNYLYPDREVTVSLPKFKLKERYILNNNLKRLGMDHVFSGANLSKMANDDRLSIDEVIHEAFIEVNEEGTEAAAVTVIAGGRSGPPPPVRVTCDHPFLFFIRDKPTGAILFWGRYTKPEPVADDIPTTKQGNNFKECKRKNGRNCKTTTVESRDVETTTTKQPRTRLIPGENYKECKKLCMQRKTEKDKPTEPKCTKMCTRKFSTTPKI
ncbi:unnamed protein product, partial [Owenia fusiformis]